MHTTLARPIARECVNTHPIAQKRKAESGKRRKRPVNLNWDDVVGWRGFRLSAFGSRLGFPLSAFPSTFFPKTLA
jgi:hypothetical protein